MIVTHTCCQNVSTPSVWIFSRGKISLSWLQPLPPSLLLNNTDHCEAVKCLLFELNHMIENLGKQSLDPFWLKRDNYMDLALLHLWFSKYIFSTMSWCFRVLYVDLSVCHIPLVSFLYFLTFDSCCNFFIPAKGPISYNRALIWTKYISGAVVHMLSVNWSQPWRSSRSWNCSHVQDW